MRPNVSTVEILTPAENDDKALLKDSQNFYYTEMQDQTSQKDVLFHDSIDDTITKTFSDPNKKQATILSTAINISNSNIGAGILGLPYAVAHTGWVTGVILGGLFSIVSIIVIHFQMIIGSNLGDTASYAIACRAIMPKFQIFADASIALMCFGAICAYFIIIGDNMSAVMKYEEFDLDSNSILRHRQVWIVIFSLLLIIPSTSLRNLDALRYTSAIALICFIYVVVIFILYTFIDSLQFGDDDFDDIGDVHAFEGGFLDVFKAIPIWLFAYGGQSLSFTASTELKNNTATRINYTIFLAYLFVTIVYLTIGLLGYYAFGDNVASNGLNNFPENDIAILIVRCGLSIAVAFSVPVIANPLKHSLASLIWKKNRDSNEDASTLPAIKFFGISYCIIAAAFIISMIIEDLGIILSVIGGTAGVAVRLIIPSVFYYFSDNMNCDAISKNPYHNIKKTIAIVLFVCGIIIIPLSLVVSFAL